MEAIASDLAELYKSFVGDIDPDTEKGQKRRAILDTATTMFAELGYRGTNMDQLAAAVGVAKGTLYLYFPKKVDLLFACAAREKLEWVPKIAGVLEGEAPAPERLKQWIVATLMLPSRSPLMCRLLEDGEMAAMLTDYPSELLAEHSELGAQMMKPLLDELAGPEHRWSPVEIRDRVHVIRSLAFIAPSLRHEGLRPGMSAERFSAIFADLIVDGIRPREHATGEAS